MKIEGTGRTSGTKGASKADAKKRTGDSSFSDMVDDTAEMRGAAPASKALSVGQLDALLSLQEAPGGAGESAKRAKKRASSLLDQLDRIKLELLSGGIPQSSLSHLNQLIKSHRETVMDPDLGGILDEIELRVQVELAKHGGDIIR